MRNLWRGLAVLVAALAATAVGATTAGAEEASQGAQNPADISVAALLGPQVPLAQSYSQTLQGDYVAAGVGMRNVGGGTISIALPAGSTVEKAFLYWSVIRPAGPAAPNTGTLNGTAIAGTLIGSSGTPCWLGDALIDNFRADVTAIAVDGVNTLTAFPSGVTDNSPPQSNATPPLLEGATLVVVFENAGFDDNTVVIRDGAQTFAFQSVSTAFGMFTAAPGTVADGAAQTSYVVADGQARFPNDRASFNATFVAGPGTAVKTADAFDGADGIVPVFALDGLWDTLNLDVSSFFTPGVPTAATPAVEAGSGGDCLTWVAQVLSVKTASRAGLDIKPGSFPNSIKLTNNGVIPVALLGSASFDVTDVDWSTVAFAGDTTEAHGTVHYSDVNGDGFLDAVLHFETQETNIAAGDTEACLTGLLTNSVAFIACDSVRPIP